MRTDGRYTRRRAGNAAVLGPSGMTPFSIVHSHDVGDNIARDPRVR